MTDIYNKINTPAPIPNAPSKSGAAKPEKKGDDAFGKILSEQIQSKNISNPERSSASLLEIQGTFQASRLNEIFLDQNQLTDKANDTLSLFEQYAAILGDPDKNLKQAYRVLEKVLLQSRSLEKELSNESSASTTGRQELQGIITQLLTAANVEQIKFDRGDYL